MRPVVLTIAGSDPSGGAGIQADIKTIEANGGYAAAAIAALTVQNSRGVERAMTVGSDWIEAQLRAVLEDLPVCAVKSGMLGDGPAVGAVATTLRRYPPEFYVCDPVLRSSSDHALLSPDAVARLKSELLPLATLVTPNVPELEALSGREVCDVEQATSAAMSLIADGAQAVLVTGGHLADRPGTDVLVDARGRELFAGEFIDARQTHGTGCVFSAAIATQLALGLEMAQAIREAKRFVGEAIRHGLTLGAGTGPVDPFFGRWKGRKGR